MPEPQSTAFFLLMLALFGALMWWLAVARQLVFRILAACLAFLPAMVFGIAAVNKYYDYYQNWNAAFSDLSGVQCAAGTARRGDGRLGQVRLAAGQQYRYGAGRSKTAIPSGSPCRGRPAT